MKVALLITTYNEEKRTPMYQEVIRWWLKNTAFHLFVVDSANNSFGSDIEQNNRVSVYHFNQNDFIKHNPRLINPGPTVPELLSLEKSISFFKEFHNYDFVFKLTGKYTLPEFETTIQHLSIPDDVTFICQYIGTVTHWQHTELLGIRVKDFQTIISQLKSYKTFFEKSISLLIQHKQFKFIKLPPLKNTSTYARNDRSHLTSI